MNANTGGPQPRRTASGRSKAEPGQSYRPQQVNRPTPNHAGQEIPPAKPNEIQHAQVSHLPRKKVVEDARAQQVRFRLRIPKQLRNCFNGNDPKQNP